MVRRYGQFSTAGAFVLVRVRNKANGEEADVVCENTQWFLVLYRDESYATKNENEYLSFMLNHDGECFEISDNAFCELSKHGTALATSEYEVVKQKGLKCVVGTYFTKLYWNAPANTGPYAYFVTDQRKLAHDRSFIRMLLEMGVVVRRECESGQIYVEPDEVDKN